MTCKPFASWHWAYFLFLLHIIPLVLNLRARLPRGLSINFYRGVSVYTLYNMGSFISEFTNTYICFYNLFNVKEA